MPQFLDLSPLLKVSARLLDLHDSRRGYGEGVQYQTEERSGQADGRYVAIGALVLQALQEHGKRTGDEFASLTFLAEGVCRSFQWAREVDVEYVLNVLSRPSELKLLQGGQDDDLHVIGDKETNLVDKAAHVSEFRLSRIGKIALAMAADHLDITYIEGDIVKLIRALEAGRLGPALGFVDRLLDLLRTEYLSLVALSERFRGTTRAGATDLAMHVATMQRAVEMVNTAQLRIDEIIQNDNQVSDDVPIGLVRERINELSRGIVRYAREISHFAARSAKATTTSVDAPAFGGLAKHWVLAWPEGRTIAHVLKAMGPVLPQGVMPQGVDFAGTVKARSAAAVQGESMTLEDYLAPPEQVFAQWLEANRQAVEQRVANGGLSLQDAIDLGLGSHLGSDAFDCLVAALASPESWSDSERLRLTLGEGLSIKTLQSSHVMYSNIRLQIAPEGDEKESPA